MNEHFVALVPFWAVLAVRRRWCCRAATGGHAWQTVSGGAHGLADIMQRLTARYDNLFEISFPYSMGWHQAPTDGQPHEEWHFHAHFYPPLLRSATVKKFMVGFEMLGNPQRDITPEMAAARLRSLSEEHYALAVAP